MDGMRSRPFFSIIMPSYNSEKTIGTALQSIRRQDIDKSEVEILVIDGGSADKTRMIAKKFSAIILDNPRRLPEYAKVLGFQHARGRYVIEMDSDEEFLEKDQLTKRMDFLMRHREVKAYMANITLPVYQCGVASGYICYCGDPFSYFVFGLKKTKIDTFKKFIDSNKNGEVIFRLKKNDLIPVVDGGTVTLSLDYMKEHFSGEWNTVSFACTAFDKVVGNTKCCGCIKSDSIRHYSNGKLSVYLSKLRFRVINNLFYKGESGFSARNHSSRLGFRKMMFVLYCMSFIFPLLDSIKLSIIYGNWRFLLHIFYLYYVDVCIFYYLIKSLFGRRAVNDRYGK